MTNKTKDQIKAFFLLGSKPTQSQFGDLIDSYIDRSGPLGTLESACSGGGTGPLIATTGTPSIDTYANLRTSQGITVYTTAQVTSIIGGSAYRGAVVYNSVPLAVSANTLSFDTEAIDTDSIHSTASNKTRMTVPAGVTKVKLHGQMAVSDAETGSYRYMTFNKNGGAFSGPTVFREMTVNGSTNRNVLEINSPTTSVAAGDYFELYAASNTSAAHTINASAGATWFEMEIIG